MVLFNLKQEDSLKKLCGPYGTYQLDATVVAPCVESYAEGSMIKKASFSFCFLG